MPLEDRVRACVSRQEVLCLEEELLDRVLEHRVVPIASPEGVTQVVWTARDVSGLRSPVRPDAEAELSALRERLSWVFENGLELQSLLRVEGDDVLVEALNRASRATAERLGVPAVLGARLGDLGVHPEAERRLAETCRRVVQGNTPEQRAYALDLPGGRISLEVRLSPLPPDRSGARHVLWCARDVTAQDREREELRLHSEILMAMGEGALLVDEGGTIVFANRALHEMFGYPEGELVGAPVGELDDPGGGEHETPYGPVSFRGVVEDERPRRRKDGSRFLSRARITAIRRGERRLFVSIHADVTAQRRAEEQLRASLREKVTLLREVHHRVKNNLQIICSLLALQRGATPEAATTRVILDCEERVRAIALIHELLYQSKNLAEIDFGEYARKMVAALATVHPPSLSFSVSAEAGLGVGLDAAVPLGFILHELADNAASHGFPPPRTGRVQVRLSRAGEILTLEVEDDGVGLPEDWATRVNTRLGLSLVRALTEQLDGRFTLVGGNGTLARLEAPLHG